jgi:hypothetical protein
MFSCQKSMLSEEDEWMTPEEVAETIVDVIAGACGYKGGDVIEVLKARRRLVLPAEMPSGPGATASNASMMVSAILEQLRGEGESHANEE